MKSEADIERCLETYERAYKNELNEETKKLWRVLIVFCKFVLDRRDTMYYPGFPHEVNVDDLPPLSYHSSVTKVKDDG